MTQEFARHLTEVSHDTRRQVGALVDRRGAVTHVMVGDANGIELPDWGRLRAGRGRLRGLRCIHTHLRDEPLNRDDLTDLALLRLDAMLAIGVDENGLPTRVYAAALQPSGEGTDAIEHLEPAPAARFDFDFRVWINERESELARGEQTRLVAGGERAILVSVSKPGKSAERETSTAELVELAASAGVEVVELVSQQRTRPDVKYSIGAGRLQDLAIRAFQSDVDLVIFDQNLTPTQARNLGERMELRVIDRTQLILDIFAQRATSRDGKLQVELAQLRYRLPRLAQRDTSLSRLAGGIGGRGPGETKLEVDRRRVRDRVARLERELKKLRRGREERRRHRSRQGLPVLSIVGYTNAGKSTLLRALTQTQAHVEAKMFATLDPASRRLRFPEDRDVIITDTVGFIRDLPAELVAAFRATLEELEQADLFLHVVDASTPDLERRLKAVWKILDEIGLSETPELVVLNKADQLDPEIALALAARHRGIPISAQKGTGLERLLERASDILWDEETRVPSHLNRL